MKMNKSKGSGGERIVENVLAQRGFTERTRAHGKFIVEIERRGKIIEVFEQPNLIVNQGLTYKTGVALLDSTKISAWYGIPIDASPTIVAGDTYASHAGWAEITDYDEATRQVWTGVAGAAGVATNAAARIELTISAGGATIGGLALVGGGSDPTVKGNTAGGGTLFSASAFSGGNRALSESDVLRITYQYTFANA
jgi:hypothetical protein